MYNIEEVKSNTLKYFNGDEMATDVWINKYALRDSEGNYLELTPDDMHKRMAKEFAKIEQKYKNPLSENEIYNYLKDFKYIVPQGGSMAGIGNTHQITSLSNCFVIHNSYDSYGSILDIDQKLAQISKRRGGVGTDLSVYRPQNAPVKNSARTSTGVVPFAERFSNTIKEVAQNGRRGALMLTISVKHPDSEDFIDAKLKDGKIDGANISVKITDEFMDAVVNDKKFIQQYPINSNNPIITKEVNARELWNKIVKNAWSSAEPGILFWDKIVSESPADSYKILGYETVSTNPCGELPLPDKGSCILLVLNLFSYVDNPFTKKAKFNFQLFSEHVKIAQRLTDDVVDLEIEKVQQIIKKVESDPEPDYIKQTELSLWKGILEKHINSRRTGLGITALGDMLAALNYTYGNSDNIEFINKLFKEFSLSSYKSSIELAKERGAFPIFNYDLEKDNIFINRLNSYDPTIKEMIKKYGRRNISNMTIAPTGSLSILTQTTSGVEPVFKVAYKRRRKINDNDSHIKVDFVDNQGIKWQEYYILHNKFKDYLNVKGIDIDLTNISSNEMDDLINNSPYKNSTSDLINWVDKVKLQGEIQKYIDHAISATTNIPKDTSVEIVNDIYINAWKSGCKGMTIYRDGSRSGILIDSESKSNTDAINKLIKENNALRRPKYLDCDIVRFINNKEKWIGFLGIYKDTNTNEEFPYELFTGLEESFVIPSYVDKGVIMKTKNENGNNEFSLIYKDKDGYKVTVEGLHRAFKEEYWNANKALSALLRHQVHLPTIINLVDGFMFNGITGKEQLFGTWQAGVRRILKKYLKEELSEKCPVCGSSDYIRVEGCKKCLSCGYSACG